MIDERIEAVLLWQHEQVMVFDLTGKQMPEWQHPLAREALKQAFPERFWHRGVWGESLKYPNGEVREWKDLCLPIIIAVTKGNTVHYLIPEDSMPWAIEIHKVCAHKKESWLLLEHPAPQLCPPPPSVSSEYRSGEGDD